MIQHFVFVQGMIKRRVQPEDVIINCSKDSEWPTPPAGHKWKEVRHDNTVSSNLSFLKVKANVKFKLPSFYRLNLKLSSNLSFLQVAANVKFILEFFTG